MTIKVQVNQNQINVRIDKAQLTQGIPGVDGASILNGNSAPSNTLGNNKDYYLNTSNGDFYYKSGGAWSIAINLKGAPGTNGINGTNGTNGTNGINGSIIYNGTGVPDVSLGVNNDYYLNTSNDDFYFKSSGTWSVITNLKGAQGPAGDGSGGGGAGGVDEGAGTGGADASTAYGKNTLGNNTTGTRNTAVGFDALFTNIDGNDNVAIGNSALYYNRNSSFNTAIGNYALYSNQGPFSTFGAYNTAIGYNALYSNTFGAYNIAIGPNALYSNTNSQNNIAIGNQALYSNTTGSTNTAIGPFALYSNTTGLENFAFGTSSLFSNTSGSDNLAIGLVSLYSNTTGNLNVAVGLSALRYTTTANYCVGIGWNAGANSNYDNCVSLGYNTDCTGANQVQLGNSSTSTYAFGTVQNRSDARDKANIRPTQLDLNFIMKLTPRDWQWNYRDDYKVITRNPDPTQPDIVTYLPNDGSKTRKRFHSGLIAQEVKAAADSLNLDFGGYQDHSINGGQDVLTIGYEELIAPLIRAVQQQQEMIVDLQNKVNLLQNK